MQEYEFRRLGQQAIDFHDDIRDILNNGKVAHSIVSGVPAWKADNGEMVFFTAGVATTDRRIYVRLDSSWVLFTILGAGGGAASNPGGVEGSVQYNSAGLVGPIFGGDTNLIWNSTGTSATPAYLAMVHSAGKVIIGTSTASNNDFRLGVAGAVVVGATYVPSATNQITGNGMLVEGPVSIGSQGLPGTLPSLLVAQVGQAGGAQIALRGTTDGSTAAQVLFGDTQLSNKASVQVNDLRTGVGSDTLDRRFQLFLRLVDSGGYVQISNADLTTAVLGEDPILVVGGAAAAGLNATGNLNGGQLVLMQSSLSIPHQRWNIFQANTVNGITGAATVTTITNAATVFIQGPTTAGSGVAITNNYALWINSGAVRIDGNLITGAATTPIKNSVFFTTTAIGVSSNNANDTTLIRGVIGTTSLVANTLSDGRTIRLQARGYYNTAASAPSLQWNVKVGGTTVLTTGSLQTVASVSTGMFDLMSLITCWTTGGAGTVYAQGGVQMGTGATGGQLWGMVNSGTVVINTTGANAVEVTVQWGSGAPQNNVTLTHCVGELLN